MKRFICLFVLLALWSSAGAIININPGLSSDSTTLMDSAKVAKALVPFVKADSAEVSKALTPQSAVVAESIHAAAGHNTYVGNVAAGCTTVILGTVYVDSNTVYKHNLTADSVKATVLSGARIDADTADGNLTIKGNATATGNVLADTAKADVFAAPAGSNTNIGTGAVTDVNGKLLADTVATPVLSATKIITPAKQDTITMVMRGPMSGGTASAGSVLDSIYVTFSATTDTITSTYFPPLSLTHTGGGSIIIDSGYVNLYLTATDSCDFELKSLTGGVATNVAGGLGVTKIGGATGWGNYPIISGSITLDAKKHYLMAFFSRSLAAVENIKFCTLTILYHKQ